MEFKNFPVLDRQTPILDKLRERSVDGDGNENVVDFSNAISESLIASDKSGKRDAAIDYGEELRTSLAEDLGVEEEEISEEIITFIQELILEIRPEDVLVQEVLEEQGIEASDSQEEEVEDEETEGDEKDREEAGDGEEEEEEKEALFDPGASGSGDEDEEAGGEA